MSRKQHPILGELVTHAQVSDTAITPQRVRTIILLLAGSVALMMTGYGIIMPVFARRLGEFGEGVEALGLMTTAFALAQLIASPILGGMADKHGRRPFILLALSAVTLSYVGYIFAPNTAIFITIRAAAGAFTAGLFPAAMGIVADIVPEERRAQWVGVIMGSYAIGMIFGPALGGFLYDGWGFAAPFALSAVIAFLALIAALFLVPETRTSQLRLRETLELRRKLTIQYTQHTSLWAALPRPLAILGTLLFVDFVGSFAFAFVEPQMVFYMYEQLEWTTVMFGLVVGAYGIAMVTGQLFLGQLSDHWGRKPVILFGLMLNMFLYVGMAILDSFRGMAIFAFVAGFGQALYSPALSAYYLDITAEEHRSRIVGIKESSLALGGVLGPMLIAVLAPRTTPQGIFWIAFGMVLVSLLLGVALLREPKRLHVGGLGVPEEVSRQRAMAAQASLRGIVMVAESARRENQLHSRQSTQK